MKKDLTDKKLTASGKFEKYQQQFWQAIGDSNNNVSMDNNDSDGNKKQWDNNNNTWRATTVIATVK